MLKSVAGHERMLDRAWLVLAEFAIVVALFVAVIDHHIYGSKTPYLFLPGWASLRFRGFGWKAVGFAPSRRWANALAIGVAATRNRIVRMLRQPAAAGPRDRQDARSIGFFRTGGKLEADVFSFFFGCWALWAKKSSIADIS
jgi:hypothetical protein